MPAKRTFTTYLDTKTIRIELSDGTTYGPIEKNKTTEVLTKMIAVLDGRLAKLEANAR